MNLLEMEDADHSDDGSYELVDCEENNYHNEENLNAFSDLEADTFAYDKDNRSDVSDGSYELVGIEEFDNHCLLKEESSNHANDSFEEDPSVESDCQSVGSEFSETEGDVFKMFTSCQLRTIASPMADYDPFKFPVMIKNKEHMELKDVVKDHVLPLLPAKALVRSRVVSREWDQWITSPFLVHKQGHLFQKTSGFFQDYDGSPWFISLDHYAYGVPSPSLSFLPERVAVRSSCNGLLLCEGCDKDQSYYICNPANEKWVMLPPPKYYHGEIPNIVLAFEPAPLNFDANFQVVCAISLPLIDGPIISFEIYDSMTKSWTLSNVDCVELGDSFLMENGFCINGVAYWETAAGQVLAFDMKNEICGVQPLPFERTGQGILSQMNGELCYVEANQESEDTVIVDVFTGCFMSSKHSMIVDLPTRSVMDGCKALPCVSNDAVAFLMNNSIYVYSVMDQKVQETRVPRSWTGAKYCYYPYVNSLVTVAGK